MGERVLMVHEVFVSKAKAHVEKKKELKKKNGFKIKEKNKSKSNISIKGSIMTRIGTGNTSYADLRSNVKEYNQTIKDLPFERVDRLTASFVVGTTELQRNGNQLDKDEGGDSPGSVTKWRFH